MNRLLTILFIVFFYSITAHGQAINLNATRFIGGDSSCGASLGLYSISTDDGGILSVGFTICYQGGGDIPANFADTPYAGSGNAMIAKMDSNMNVNWVRIFGGNHEDYAVSAIQTKDGGYAILGYTTSNDSDVSGNHGTGDLWLIRTDSSGNLLWQKCYGSFYDEQPISLALTKDNGFILFGVSNGIGDDVPNHYSGSEFDYDWLVVKTDSIGDVQWSKSIGGTGDEEPYGSVLSVGNSYYLVSSSSSTDFDCTDTAWCAGNANNMGYNYYVFKLDSVGNIIWRHGYGGSDGDIATCAIWDDEDSSMVINGIALSHDYMVTGAHGGEDMWVIKVDNNGILKWEKPLGWVGRDDGSGILKYNEYYIVYGNTNAGDLGLTNSWIFVLDTNGDTISNKLFGGTSYEDPASIVLYKSGFAATGGSCSPGFSEGTNLGILPGFIEDMSISYFNYWPLTAADVSMKKGGLFVYPNPTKNSLTISCPDVGGQIVIMNSVGTTLFKRSLKASENYVSADVTAWAGGLYIVKWVGENETVLISKLIKN